jgi:RNA polymerase primary sigma factor
VVRDAKHELIAANLRLVVWVARRYQGRGLSLDELVQEGTLGLMKAVDRFQYRRGLRFANYATWWIRHEILRALSHHARTIRIPVYMLERLHLLMRLQRELGSKLAREPSPEELAQRSGMSIDEVRLIFESSRRPISLETPVIEELTIGDSLQDEQTPSPDEMLMEQDQVMYLQHALASLAPREEEIVRHRFGIGGAKAQTLEELAGRFSVTRERIRQIEASALAKLRASLHADAFGAYVGN